LKKAGSELFGLLALPGLRAPLTEFVGQPQVTEGAAVKSGALSNVSRKQVTFALAPGRKVNAPALSFAWLVEEGAGFAAAGKSADPLLEQVVASARSQADTLANKADIASAVQRMGDQVALYAYLDARVALAPDAPQPAPVLFAVGRRDSAGYLRVEIAKPAIDLMLHSAVGL
jgi:hypothetical protein